MAKEQSRLRDAIDWVYAQDDYLTYDGAAVAEGKLSQIFFRAVKPEYIAVTAASIIEYAITGENNIAKNIAYLALSSEAVKLVLRSFYSAGNFYYDTEGRTKEEVSPSQASKVLQHKNFAKIALSGLVFGDLLGGSLHMPEIIAGERAVLDARDIGGYVMVFGYYWRAKQVLDNNWSVSTQKPKPRQYSLKEKLSNLISSPAPATQAQRVAAAYAGTDTGVIPNTLEPDNI